MQFSIEVVLRREALSPREVWQRVLASHGPTLEAIKNVDLDDKPTLASEVLTHLTGRKSGRLHAGWGNTRVNYLHVANHDLSLVRIENGVAGEEDARAWVEAFLGEDVLVQARMFAEDFEFWQNAEDLLHYDAAGKPHRHLPKRSNGLPPPLSRTIVDVSRNPGRRLLRRGFVECVGSPMWFGPLFWRRSGTKKSQVCSEDWLRCREEAGASIRIDPIGNLRQGLDRLRIPMDRLRRLLYPSSEKA